MHKWQYALLEAYSIYDQEKWRYEFYFHGKDGKAQKVKIDDAVVALNHLGALGWELVSVSIKQAGFFSGTLHSGTKYQSADQMVKQFWLKLPVPQEE